MLITKMFQFICITFHCCNLEMQAEQSLVYIVAMVTKALLALC